MRSLSASRFALFAIILTGSVYGALSTPARISESIGGYFEAAVITFLEELKECYITTPFNQNVIFVPHDESDDKFELLESSNLVGCRVRVKDLNVNDTGIWTITAQTLGGSIRTQSYNVIVNSPTENNPSDETTPEPSALIRRLDELSFDTIMGNTHQLQIPKVDFVDTDSCFITTPEGTRINLETEDIPGIETIKDSNVACGVILTVKDEAQVGQWILISRGTSLTSRALQETWLPFTIKVTEKVNAVPNKIAIGVNRDFYIRLEKAIDNPESCKLLRPDGSQYTDFERDPRFHENCGFIVRNVNDSDDGLWRILYGERITFSAPFEVTIRYHTGQNHTQVFFWTRDQPVNEIFGSVLAIYCKVIDPEGVVVSETFGKCNITLPRATNAHEGIWRMHTGVRGHVLTEESLFKVHIIAGSPKAIVETTVTANEPILTLSCKVVTPHPVHTCKFRAPGGRILIANPGVGEDRYTFHGQGSSYESGFHTHDCGIQITKPTLGDLGFWRCAIETTHEAYYGFLTAWSPWLIKDPEVAAGILTAPYLTAERTSINAIEGDSVRMSCSIQSSIRYCYFRSNNGTVYNVGPGFSSSDIAEYAGAGLDAGECSIRFRSLREADRGSWSCRVGFHNSQMSEKQVHIGVFVKDIMSVRHTHESIEIMLGSSRPLDYCRFVRFDGLGFTNKNAPKEYSVDTTFLHLGQCILWFRPGPLEARPWNVAVRITGQDQEISRTTSGISSSVTPQITPHRIQILWIVFLLSGIAMIVLGTLIGPKKNRDWTYAKASNIRQSFRNRFAKKAVVESNVTEKNTANAA